MQRWPKRDFGQKYEAARDTYEETATLPLQMAEQLLGSGVLQLHQSASAYEHQRGSGTHSIDSASSLLSLVPTDMYLPPSTSRLAEKSQSGYLPWLLR